MHWLPGKGHHKWHFCPQWSCINKVTLCPFFRLTHVKEKKCYRKTHFCLWFQVLLWPAHQPAYSPSAKRDIRQKWGGKRRGGDSARKMVYWQTHPELPHRFLRDAGVPGRRVLQQSHGKRGLGKGCQWDHSLHQRPGVPDPRLQTLGSSFRGVAQSS